MRLNQAKQSLQVHRVKKSEQNQEHQERLWNSHLFLLQDSMRFWAPACMRESILRPCTAARWKVSAVLVYLCIFNYIHILLIAAARNLLYKTNTP